MNDEQFGRLFITIGYILLGIGLVVVCYYVINNILNVAHGDDNEDEVGLCLRGYETHCQPTLMQKLLKRAQEWNIQKAKNETLDIAERFEDEEINDPDQTDNGMEEYGYCEGNLTTLDREFCK